MEMNRFRLLSNYQFYDDSIKDTDTVTINSEYTKELRNYRIYGNSIQDGTPSPDNPVEIQSLGTKMFNLWRKENVEIEQDAGIECTWEEDFYGEESVWKDKESGIVQYTVTNFFDTDMYLEAYLILPAGTYSYFCNIYSNSELLMCDVDGNNGESIKLDSGFAIISSTKRFMLHQKIDLPGFDGVLRTLLYEGEYTIDTIPRIDRNTPDNQIPEHYGKYKIPIEVRGKNLFDIDNMEYIHYGSSDFYPKVENGLFISPGKNGVSFYWMPVIKIKPLTTYTVAFDEISGVTNRGIVLYDDMNRTNPITINKSEFINSKRVFTLTTSNTSNYLAIAVAGANTYTATISNIQIEEGIEATEYEPYQEPQTYSIFLDEPLQKTRHEYTNPNNGTTTIAEFIDYIDFMSGKVIRHNKGFILDGSYPIQLANWRYVEGYHAVGYARGTFPDLAKQEKALLCNKLVAKMYGDLYSMDNPAEGISLHNSSTYSMFLRLKTDDITDVDGYKEYLNKNPLTIVAGLAEPIEESIDDLPRLILNKGTNFLKIKTTIQPSQVDWQYYK